MEENPIRAVFIPKPETPPEYAAVARASRKRQQATYDAYRKVDTELHVRAWKADNDRHLRDMEKLHQESVDAVAESKADVSRLLAESRDAEERLIQANEHMHESAQAYKRIKGTGDPADETKAHIEAEMAKETFADADAKAQRLRDEYQDAFQTWTGEKEILAERERYLHNAKARAAQPVSRAPISDATIAASLSYLILDDIWAQLSKDDRIRVNRLAAKPVTTPEEWRSRETV